MAENQNMPVDWEGNIVRSLVNLNQTIGTLRETYQKQNLYDIVTPFEGEPSFKCVDWICSIEKFAELHGNTDEATMCKLAYMTARGPCSDFINRWNLQQTQLAAQQQIPVAQFLNWKALKKNIMAHFGEITDSEHAHDELREIKQFPDETLTFYGERIHRLYKDAYSVEDLGDAASQRLAQRQIVNYFIDGLANQSIQFKVIRKQPSTLDAALKIAQEEDTLLRRFHLRCPRLHEYSDNQWDDRDEGGGSCAL